MNTLLLLAILSQHPIHHPQPGRIIPIVPIYAPYRPIVVPRVIPYQVPPRTAISRARFEKRREMLREKIKYQSKGKP